MSLAPEVEPSSLFAPRLGWLAGVLLIGGVLLAVSHRAEEREIARLLREAQPAWLLAAAALQAATYACAAGVWHRALARGGVPVPFRRLLPLALAKLFTDRAVPSAGISGTLLVVRALERRGVERDHAVAAVVTGLLAFYLGYLHRDRRRRPGARFARRDAEGRSCPSRASARWPSGSRSPSSPCDARRAAAPKAGSSAGRARATSPPHFVRARAARSSRPARWPRPRSSSSASSPSTRSRSTRPFARSRARCRCPPSSRASCWPRW